MATITGDSLANLLNGTPGADEILGLAGNDTLEGLGGDDTLDGGTGNDSLVGGDDFDFVTYRDASQSVNLSLEGNYGFVGSELDTLNGIENVEGSPYNDYLLGDNGPNVMHGGAGDDQIYGDWGNDTLIGGAGRDSLAGESGDDVLVASATASASGPRIVFTPDAVAENFDEGADTVYSGSNFELPDNVEHLVLTGAPMWRAYEGRGNDLGNVIVGEGAARHNLYGEGGSDTLVGGSSRDLLDGGAGADSMQGGGGDDVLVAGQGDELLVDGGAGFDTLRASGAGVALDLASANITEIEAVDLTGSGNNVLALDVPSLLAASGETDTLRVDGNAGDRVVAGAGWEQGSNVVIGGQTYAVYTQGSATLQVDLDVDREGVVAPLSGLLNGTDGFRLIGIDASDWSGFSVAAAGDVNHDGYGDVIVGAKIADGSAGESYVVFGSASGFGASLSLGSLTGTNGFRLDGSAGELSGHAVASAGDVNGDGIGDIIVGAPYAAGVGRSYVVFGTDGGYDSGFALSSLDGANGFRLDGSAGQSGYSVASAGDINGDGYGDLVVGAPYAGVGGQSHVVFGRAGGFTSSLALSTLDGSNGFQITAVTGADKQGWSVASAGDVNGDGYGDLIVGARDAEFPGGPNAAGESYVVFGHGGGFGSSFALSDLDGANGFRLNGIDSIDVSGWSVAAAGDVNGDGYGDVIVGAKNAEGGAGESYVVFGGSGGYLDTLHGVSGFNLAGLTGANGFRLDGEGYSGISVAAAGDVNGDGFDDVIVGAYRAAGYYAGTSFVVFGKAAGFSAAISLDDLGGADGLRLDGLALYDFSGKSVASAGDVNGDGYGDLIIGAYGASGLAGESYVVYGRDFTAAVDREGGAGNDYLGGTPAGENFVAGGGNDTLNGGGGADAFRGGAGDDRIVVGDLAFRDVDGGTGHDTLAVAVSNATLDLGGTSGARISGIETIDLAGANVTLTLDALDVARLGEGRTLRVTGGADDVLNGGGGWSFVTAFSDGGQQYVRYAQGAVTLEVDADIDHGLGSAFYLVDLDGATGTRFTGEGSGDRAGRAVSGAGDFNGDQFADIIIGAQFEGAAYVVFGGSEGFGTTVPLSSLDGTNGFKSGGFARSVSAGGDINGDGYGDVLISDPTSQGFVKVIFGVASGAAPGITLMGSDSGDHWGSAVSHGDINGDGFADILFGASYLSSNTGEAYVVFGTDEGNPVVTFTSNGLDAFRFRGEAAGDRAGDAVAAADLNGDGYDDYIFSAPFADPNGTSSGALYVYFGKETFFPFTIHQLQTSPLDGTNGIKLLGEASSNFAGYSISGGDVNGDGIEDLVIGANNASSGGHAYNGVTYVLYGSTAGFGAIDGELNLSAIDGTNGFRIIGVADGDKSGYSVAAAGDLNGDGYGDIAIGAPHTDENGEAGTVYVVFGRASGFGPELDLASLDGTNGFRIVGEDPNLGPGGGELGGWGKSVAAAGDVNGDGYDDLIVGALKGDVNGMLDAGKAYVIYGRDFTGTADFVGGSGSDTLTGAGADENLIGGLGDDWLDGGAGADALIGAVGDDTLVYGAGDLRVDGGPGDDTLLLVGGGINLDLTAPSGGRITGIERIDLTGTGNNSLTLDYLRVGQLVDGPYTLRVLGDAGDSVIGGQGWDFEAYFSDGGQDYARYSHGGIRLEIDRDVTHDIDARIHLANLDGGNGLELREGSVGVNYTGRSVSGAGDVDGDGVADLLVGRPGEDFPATEVGSVYVLPGSAGAFNHTLNIGTASIRGETGGSLLGSSVSGAGDVNGDGLSDILAGAYGRDVNGTDAGAAYVVFTGSFFNVSTLTGTNGFELRGEAAGDLAGFSVSDAGDINGDGYGDLLIGAHSNDGGGADAGAAYVVFGKAAGFAPDLELSALTGGDGFKIAGEAASDHFGYSVSSAGDVNNDGYDDLLIGAKGSNGEAGAAYVVFGTSAAFGATFALSTLNGGNGFAIHGEAAGDLAGISVSSAGDINADGYDDLVIGASGRDVNGAGAGAAYVVFGKATGFAADLDLSTLDGSNGFEINGEAASDFAGFSVSGAGDVNSDGYDDLLIGAWGSDANGADAGAAYLVFGKASGFAANLDLSTLTGGNGIEILGESAGDHAGYSVAVTGDVNGDEFDDMLIGAPERDRTATAFDAGSAYVVFGSNFTGGSTADDDLAGTAGANTLLGAIGDDTLAGNGGADVFRGGAGNDRIEIADTGFLDVDGGTGTDMLALNGSGIHLDFTAVAAAKVSGIEAIDLTGSGNNQLTIALADVLALADSLNPLTGTLNTLVVTGDDGDVVNGTYEMWTAAGTDTIDGLGTFNIYTKGSAAIWAHEDVNAVSLTYM